MIRHPALFYLTPFLIPLTVMAKPPVLPRAAAPIPVPVSSQFVGADGTRYLLSGVLSLQVDSQVTPIPPVTGLRATSSTGAAIDTAPAGTILFIVGTGMGQYGYVTVAGLSAPVITWTPTLVRVTLPLAGGAAASAVGPISIKPGDAPPQTSALPFTITGLQGGVTPTPTPTPPPVPGVGTPLVSAYQDADGSPLVLPKYGQEVRIVGSGFGITPGRVYWQGGSVVIKEWSDTLIRVQLPSPVFTGATQFSLWRPDGIWAEFGVPADGPGRVPGSAKRR